jgi:hypothetical protein
MGTGCSLRGGSGEGQRRGKETMLCTTQYCSKSVGKEQISRGIRGGASGKVAEGIF